MRGEDDQEALELREMYERARAYLQSHAWCNRITEQHFAFGVGGVVAVFLFRVRVESRADEQLWVVEGDLPSAYLVTDRAPNAAAALEVYIELMRSWISAVRDGSDMKQVFPVNAPRDEEHASLLERRLEAIRRHVIPAARCRS